MLLELALSLAVQDLSGEVARRVRELSDADPAVRDAATEAIRALGPCAAPILEAIESFESPEVEARVRELVRWFRDGPTHPDEGEMRRVTLTVGPGLLTEALPAVCAAGGFAFQYGLEDNPAVPRLEFRDVPFLQAIDELCRAAGVGYALPTGEARQMFTWVDGQLEQQPRPARPLIVSNSPPLTGPAAYVGPVRIGVRRIAAVHDNTFDAARSDLRVWLEVRWQPDCWPSNVSHELIEATKETGESLLPARPPWEEAEEYESNGLQGKVVLLALPAPAHGGTLTLRGAVILGFELIQRRVDVDLAEGAREVTFEHGRLIISEADGLACRLEWTDPGAVEPDAWLFLQDESRRFATPPLRAGSEPAAIDSRARRLQFIYSLRRTVRRYEYEFRDLPRPGLPPFADDE